MSYNPNTNYAAEIKKAIESGASASTVKALNDARNEKISANQDHYSSIGVSSNDSYGSGANKYTGGSSGGSSSQKTVSYVNPGGNAVNIAAGTDYQAKINDAVAKGDYSAAAIYEQMRNAKINAPGYSGSQATTSNYTQYLNGGEYQAALGDYVDQAAEAAGVSTTGATPDYSEYLKELYRANTEKELANLKSTYEQNTADLESNAEKIPKTYEAAKNQAAAQNDIQNQAFNEYAASRGLNTGTSGQAELSRSSALQGNLATINSNQANALAENALQMQKLAIQYRNAADAAEASGNADLAKSLYSEYVRQAEAATAAAGAAQEQSNWDKQYQLTQEQNTQSEADTNRKYAYDLATSMLEAGLMPDASTLSTAGITSAAAAAIRNAALQKTALSTTSKRSGSSGSSGSSKKKSSGSSSSEANVSDFYKKFGVTRNTNAGKAFSSGEYQKFLYEVGMSRGNQGRYQLIKDAYDEGKISESQVRAIAEKFKISLG